MKPLTWNRSLISHISALTFRVIVLTAITLVAFMATSARADLFVTQYRSASGGFIGQYTDSGGIVNEQLITGFRTPIGIASYGSRLFIGDLSAGSISAYTTSGFEINLSLVTGLTDPRGIAVDSAGQNLFVALPDRIGKYDTVTGQGTDSLITLANFPFSIASSGTNLFITTTDGINGMIEKYDTQGNHLATLLVSSKQLYGIAVDASGQFLYTDAIDGSVAEYSATTGSLIKQLASPGQLLGQTPYGMTLDGSNLYVVTGFAGQPSHVAKYNLATDEWNTSLITSSGSIGITAASVPEPSTYALLGAGALALLALKRRRA